MPHYIPDAPNPKATRSLLRRFEMVTGIDTGYAGLDTDASDWEKRVDEAVAGDPEITAYLQVKDLKNTSNDSVFIFNGWTFASSPALKTFDHPVYDIWLVKCYS